MRDRSLSPNKDVHGYILEISNFFGVQHLRYRSATVPVMITHISKLRFLN